MLRRLYAIGPSLVLAGCFSGGPSESDIKEAVRPMLASDYEHIYKRENPRGPKTLDDFVNATKLGGCKEASGSPGYRCDFSVLSPGSGDRVDLTFRFVKEDGRWRRSNN
jgi:hypothetical protein